MWSRVDDNIPHHPKFIKAGAIASWLWVCGNCYCNRYLTDGFISHDVLTTLGNIPKVTKHATTLVLTGLWEAVDGGYLVHDFHDHNPRAVDVKSKREADRVRKESARNPDGIRTDSSRNPEVPAPAIPIPSHPIPIPSDPKSTEDRARRYAQTPIIPRNPHLSHVFCDGSYCVPASVHHKLADLLAPKHAGDRGLAAAALLTWYPTVTNKLVNGFVMGDAFRFWQSQFDTEFASPDPKAQAGKLTTRMAAAIANIQRETANGPERLR